MKVGDIKTNNIGLEYQITDIYRKGRVDSKTTYEMAIVKFLKTGTVKECYTSNLFAGKVRDDYAVSVYGVGYLGFRDKSCGYYVQAKQLWQNMIKRCYCEKDLKGYYGKGVTVDPRWHCLTTFISDLPKLKNFDRWLNAKKNNESWNLDKDFLGDGTVYSFYTCQFLTEHENKSAGAKATKEQYWKNRKLKAT